MNERIRELARQADPDYTGNVDDDMGNALVGNEAIEKFAELIITECCSATEGQPRSEIRNSILKRFGLTVPDLSYKEIKK